MTRLTSSGHTARVLLALALGGMMAATAVRAQVVFTTEDLDKAMKAIGRNLMLVNAAIEKKEFDEAKVRVIRAREQLTPTVSFWQNAKKPDAMKMVRTATARLDDLDVVLSRPPVDASRAAAAIRDVDAACQACHAVYREEDPATKTFRLKGQPAP
jgi:cytochrome c556